MLLLKDDRYFNSDCIEGKRSRSVVHHGQNTIKDNRIGNFLLSPSSLHDE